MSEVFERNSFFTAYLKWHYGQGLREFFGVAGNSLWFIANFFSFKLLFKTLFAPWKRMNESYGGGLDFGAWASSFIVNGLMRAVGLVTKTVVLSVGFVSYALIIVFSLFIFVIWIFAPVILIGSIVLSATFFIV
jgi:hypothetical protein